MRVIASEDDRVSLPLHVSALISIGGRPA